MRPIIEMQFADFSTVGFNQIVNQAATLFWRTNVPCPITVRLPFGGTSGGGPFHSQCIETIYAHYPGLIVLTPATVEDAYSMLLEAVALDDPVIFCEHKFLYRHLKAEKLPSEALPIGKARIAREGRDLTIVTYSAMVHEALEAATELAPAKAGKLKWWTCVPSNRSTPTPSWPASRARDGCCASAKRGRGAASRRKSSRASRAKASACSTRRRNGSTPRTRPCRIIRICGRRTARPRAPSPNRREKIVTNMKIPIIMPQLGESIAEARIVNFVVKPGDNVEADQDLIEVETDKATMTVASPCKGKIEKFTAQLNESYAVGATLGQIEATKRRSRAIGTRRCSGKNFRNRTLSKSDSNRRSGRVQPTVRGLPVPANAAGASYLSPRLKARMDELGLHAADLAGVAGSGAAGRVTVEDFEKYIAQPRKTQDERRVVHARGRGRRDAAQLDAAHRDTSAARVPRPAVSRTAKFKSQTRPGALRVARAGVALAENSARRSARRNKIVHPSSIDVGFAVEAEDGVLVPVLRDADKKLSQRFDRALQRTGGTRARAQAAGGRDRRLHRDGDELRHVRADLGDADSAAGADARAGHGRGTARAALGRGEKTIRAGDGGEPDVELRPSRAGRRRGGTIAFAHRGFDVEAGEVVIKKFFQLVISSEVFKALNTKN
jgi:pyruvate/2-oxoglutarate dehydrogenase complex dihydrolipoamide acyltransferase (E2) component